MIIELMSLYLKSLKPLVIFIENANYKYLYYIIATK